MTPGTPVSLGNGFAVSSRLLIIVGFPDETSESDTPVTRIFYLNLDGKTLFTYQEWLGETVVSACLRRPTDSKARAGCFLSENGRVQILNSNEYLSKNLNIDPTNLGSMRSIQEIGDTLYACGFAGQVYRRENTGWEAIDGGLQDKSKRTMRQELGIGEFADQPILHIEEQLELSKQRPNFTKIDGLSENDAYLTGLNGTIMHYNGSMLSRLSSPTDVYDPSSGLDASTVIQQIDSVDDECLWIVGDRHVFRYDGVNFKKIELVDNREL